VRYGRARRPPCFGSNFEQGAAHSAKAETVGIIFTALRTDHEWFSRCNVLQCNPCQS
jgi:hypothetical protein